MAIGFDQVSVSIKEQTGERNGTKMRCGLGCGSWQPSARDSARIAG
jgi:hypothetical protein